MAASMVHRRNSHHWNPPLCPRKLAKAAQRRRQAELQAALDASRVTEADLAAMIFDPVRDSGDHDQVGADRTEDSGG